MKTRGLEGGADLSRLSANHIGHRVRALRKEKGWSVNELARRLGRAWHSVDNLENGESLPSLGTLIALVDVFELRSLEEVLGDGRLGTTVLLELEVRARLDEGTGTAVQAS